MVNLLSVPFYPQQSDGNCLPACAQMILSYYGIQQSQQQLAGLLSVRPNVGTPASTIQRLQTRHIAVVYGSATLAAIEVAMTNGQPVIAFIQAGELPRWHNQHFQHAIVVVCVEADTIYILDPAGQATPEAVSIGDFMLAWDEMDNLCAIVRRS